VLLHIIVPHPEANCRIGKCYPCKLIQYIAELGSIAFQKVFAGGYVKEQVFTLMPVP
jgi:hypothetical protein